MDNSIQNGDYREKDNIEKNRQPKTKKQMVKANSNIQMIKININNVTS